MNARTAFILLSVTAVLLGAVVVVYAFGTPQQPDPTAALAAAGPAPAASVAGDAQSQQAAETATQQAPAASQAKARLAIQIPGCVCHSKDKKLVSRHAKYRINECTRCHAGGVPAMGR